MKNALTTDYVLLMKLLRKLSDFVHARTHDKTQMGA